MKNWIKVYDNWDDNNPRWIRKVQISDVTVVKDKPVEDWNKVTRESRGWRVIMTVAALSQYGEDEIYWYDKEFYKTELDAMEAANKLMEELDA